MFAPLKYLPVPAELDFENTTIRMVVRPTIGGRRLRVRLSNEFGVAALKIGAAHIALTDERAKIRQGTDHMLTFGGNPQVTVPPGAPVISDPVDMTVKPYAELSVTIFLPSKTQVTTFHSRSKHDTYISGPGDLTAKPDLPDAQVKTNWYFLAGIDMLEPASTSAIVAFGDSITDGGGNAGGYDDWPNQLAQKLAGDKSLPAISVVNEGLSGNRILNDAAGVSALARFDRDVLAQSGATSVIVLEGVNDIGFPRARMQEIKGLPPIKDWPFVTQKVSSDEIIWGFRQIIARAHEHGLRVFGATITPFEGSNAYDLEGEAIRQEVNKWIRSTDEYDAIFDFDAAIRDPVHPSRVRDSLDSGDHIHPSAAGYKAITDTIDLKRLTGTR